MSQENFNFVIKLLAKLLNSHFVVSLITVNAD